MTLIMPLLSPKLLCWRYAWSWKRYILLDAAYQLLIPQSVSCIGLVYEWHRAVQCHPLHRSLLEDTLHSVTKTGWIHRITTQSFQRLFKVNCTKNQTTCESSSWSCWRKCSWILYLYDVDLVNWYVPHRVSRKLTSITWNHCCSNAVVTCNMLKT